MSATADPIETAPAASAEQIELPGVGPDPVGPAPRADDPEPAPKRSKSRPGRAGKSGNATPPPRAPGRPTNEARDEARRTAEVAAVYRDFAGAAIIAAPFWPRGIVVAAALEGQADKLAALWAQQAARSKLVARMIDNGANIGGVLGLVLGHLPILAAIVGPPPSTDAMAEASESLGMDPAAGAVLSMLGSLLGAGLTPDDGTPAP